jgi:ferredoxin
LASTVDFLPTGIQIVVGSGATIMAALQRNVVSPGTTFYVPCGGKGRCGRCRIRIIDGPASPPTEDERRCLGQDGLDAGIRLACQTKPLGPLRVEIDARATAGSRFLQVEGPSSPVTPDPAVFHRSVALDDLRRQGSDPIRSRIEMFLSNGRHRIIRFDPALARTFPSLRGRHRHPYRQRRRGYQCAPRRSLSWSRGTRR